MENSPLTIEKPPYLVAPGDALLIEGNIRVVDGVIFCRPWHYEIRFTDGSFYPVLRNKTVKKLTSR